MDRKLVLVTGMSGAGKTSAMNALEDLGYYCIDSYPVELLDELEELLEKKDPKYDRLALAVSASEYLAFMNFFDNLKRPMRIVFVDASDEELLLRYRFTRRQHPSLQKGKRRRWKRLLSWKETALISCRQICRIPFIWIQPS